MTTPLYLYGAEPSLYTGKIRSYLRKKAIPFEERNAWFPRYGAVMKIVGRPIIPVIETAEGDIVQDTSEIFDFLEARHTENPMLPEGPRQKLVSYILEVFGNEGMLKPAMHYRWNFPDDNFPWIFREFARASGPQTPMDDAAPFAVPFADRMQAYLPMLGVTEKTIPLIEDAYMELLGLLNEHFRLNPYFLGGRPTLGDFGMLAPLYAHLGRDPYPSNVMKKHAPFVYRWVERMNASDDGMGEFCDMPRETLEGDEIPQTLIPILKLIGQEFMPEVTSIVKTLAIQIEGRGIKSGDPVNPKGAGPGHYGAHTVPYRGTEIEIGLRPFVQWVFERGLKVYQSYDGQDKAAVDALLKDTGLYESYQLKPALSMKRENYKEYFI
jgi:glutathione S-transferase